MADETLQPVPVPAVEHLISAYNLDLDQLNGLIKEVNDISQLPASHRSSRYEQSLKRATEAYAKQIRNLIRENAAWTMIQEQNATALQESNQRMLRILNFVRSLDLSQQEREQVHGIYKEVLPASQDGDREVLDQLLSSHESRHKRDEDDIADMREQIGVLEIANRRVEGKERALRLELTEYLHPLILKVFGNATQNISALAQLHLGQASDKSVVGDVLRQQYSELLRLMRVTQRGEKPAQPPSPHSIDLGTGILPTTLAQFGHPSSFAMELDERMLPMNMEKFSEIHAEVLREVGIMTLPVLRAELRQSRGEQGGV